MLDSNRACPAKDPGRTPVTFSTSGSYTNTNSRLPTLSAPTKLMGTWISMGNTTACVGMGAGVEVEVGVGGGVVGKTAGAVVAVGAMVGFGTLLLVQLPITLLAATFGVWLFYVQHQFEGTYWSRESEWRFQEGALLSSSHYDLPPVLGWLTANIGIHHVHHLASRIPSYRLTEALADHPELRGVGRLTLRESLRCFRLALWDEDAKRLLAFRDLRTLPA